MNIIELFENAIGGRWTGVSFHENIQDSMQSASRPMYFCEAIKESCVAPILLQQGMTPCVGAQRSLGWRRDEGEDLTAKVTETSGIAPDIAQTIIRETPQMDVGECASITFGRHESPDVLISYMQPETAMQFLNLWQQPHGQCLHFSVSSLMAVCGQVAVGALKTGRISCSFGCPESRKRGNISRDRLIIGVPSKLARGMLGFHQSETGIHLDQASFNCL